MLVIGIDENGLGPVLGPMVVTGVAFESDSYDREAYWLAAAKNLPAGDSKAVFAKPRLGRAETATLRWLSAFGVNPGTHAELVDAVAMKSQGELRCNGKPIEACAPVKGALPHWADTFYTNTGQYRDYLEKSGITPVCVRAFSVCPGVFNAVTGAPDMNKLRFDFELMMRLVAELSKTAKGDILALCGKIGSTMRYAGWISRMHMTVGRIAEEGTEKSSYDIDNVGTVSFIKDADAGHLPVAVASMVGKYLRELSMVRLNQTLCPTGRPASGYWNKVTSDFIKAVEKRRHEVGLEDFCFLRNS